MISRRAWLGCIGTITLVAAPLLAVKKQGASGFDPASGTLHLQALRYEAAHNSRLGQFLVSCAARNEAFAIALHWCA